MDKKHRMDAPNNETLGNIEQVPDHSELSSLYFEAHTEWEGKELISDDERQRRRDKHNETITISILPQFARIGLLIPTPLILLALMLSAWFTYITIETLRFLLIVVIAVVGLWILITFLTIRRVYTIFYNHALSATPFIVVLLSYLGATTQSVYLLLQHSLPASLIGATLLVSLVVYGISVILSGVMLFLWVSPRLSQTARLAGLGAIALLLIVVATFAVIFA